MVTAGGQPPSVVPGLRNWPPTRFAVWRVRSRFCKVLDVITAFAGLVLTVLAAADSIASWHSDYVLVPASTLEHVAGAILLPTWPWMLVSAGMVMGVRRDRLLDLPGWSAMRHRAILVFGVAVAVVLAIVVTGFVIGADKGSLRALPGGIHQVSTLGLNHAAWTDVSAAQFRLWQARFIREDALFSLFGVWMIGFERLMRRIRILTGNDTGRR